MNKKRFIGYLFVMVSVGCIHAQEKKIPTQEYKLWYDRPAQVWTEALPLGNGRLGAMVYGTPGTEQIQLNEETIWAGRPNNNANPDALEYIPKVRELVFAGKYLEAQTLATEKVMAKTNSGMPYQSFGDLRIAFPGHTRYSDYYRELSLDSARVIVRYEVDGVRYQRETITSFTDQVVMIRLTANRPGQITLCTFCLIACDIQIVIEISGYRHIDRSFIGSFDRKNTVSTSYFSSLIPGG